MEGRWCSAAEVAADVSRAGGGVALPAPAPRAIAEACLAWGARPAPLILTEVEREREPPAPEHGAAPPPDLRGITRMLRMVQTDDTDDSSAPGGGSGGGAIVISKPGAGAGGPQCNPGARSHMNPNVAEFVPRSVSSSGGQGGMSATERREDLAARLRDDISDGRDKCSAIARLMRLYAEPEAGCASAPAPRLLTPDYFERPAAAAAAPEPSAAADGTIDNKSLVSHNISSSGTMRSYQGEGDADPAEVRASLDKVRRWLGGGGGGDGGDGPPARASPRLLLTPVTFRPRTPASPALTPPAPSAPAPVTRAYSPPARATAALHSEYAARTAAAAQSSSRPAAAADGDTLWTRLEAQLRQKDDERRARDAASP